MHPSQAASPAPNSAPTVSPRIPVVSFFTGAGGLDIGFAQAGFETVLALDSNERAVETFNANHSGNPAVVRDLRNLSARELIALVDARCGPTTPRGVIGGPPCQTFSIGNVRKSRHDHRGALGYHYARLLKALNRRYQLDFFIFENVLGIKKRRHRRQYLKILNDLSAAGFEVSVQEVDASAFGVPQLRHRVIIAGINRLRFPDARYTFPAGTSEERRTVRQAISHLVEPAYFVRGMQPKDIPFHPNHWTMMPKSRKFEAPENGEKDGRSFRRLNWDAPSRTVAYGHREVHLHPQGHRRLSVLEAMLLQGFPESYHLHGTLSDQITQVSNAVPPPLAAALANSLRQQLFEPAAQFQTLVLNWFSANARDFPWRQKRQPFDILVAEKLLQQTAAGSVVPVYQELLATYPTPTVLASAKVQDVARIIKPLGFHFRARELVELAGKLCDRHGGTVPASLPQLLALPGVGDYSARAVLAFAYAHRVPIVDTNVARILVRVFGLKSPNTANPARHRGLIAFADRFVPASAAREYNLALLDLAAAHCTAANPQCERCPLRSCCAHAKSNPGVGSISAQVKAGSRAA